MDLSKAGRVLVVTKEKMSESNTAYAQGGIAVAMGGREDIELHLEDTIVAGDGLVDVPAAEALVREGPQRVEELLAWGTAFDRYEAGARTGELMRTREGAHSLPRILHADGDATGRVIGQALLRKVRGLDAVALMEWATTVDLIVRDGRVVGATLLDADGRMHEVSARAVLLASGGAGQVYSDTTNPSVATGDGIAMAWRAGAELMDLEFYQFHPTAFLMPGAPRFLLSEALRGEGAWLINGEGERFMDRYDSRAELAPRDIVARAIVAEACNGPIFLDMRQVENRSGLKQRFPGISTFLSGYNLELARDPIPVGPAAHYMMGGVRTDTFGRTSLPGLFAAGEVACTGVHGANRLASNSLLEGLVFGAKAAEAMMDEAAVKNPAGAQAVHASTVDHPTEPEIDAWKNALRGLMWADGGLLRDARGLQAALSGLAEMRVTMPAALTRSALEARNLHALAEGIVQSALAREESRGAHFRTDFPERWPAAKHSTLRGAEVGFKDVVR